MTCKTLYKVRILEVFAMYSSLIPVAIMILAQRFMNHMEAAW